MRSRPKGLVVVAVGLALFAGACGNSTSNGSGSPAGGGNGGSTPGTVNNADLQKMVHIDEVGITDTEIQVGGVASTTNQLGGAYGDVFAGAQAYFDMVNEKGGIYGRKIKVIKNHDDQLVKNQEEVKSLIADDKVFAVVPTASLLFSGADDLVKANVPTFGWNINPEYSPPKNLFGEKGSYLCFTCASPAIAYTAKQLGSKNVGILGYSVAQSSDCAKGVQETFSKYPVASVAFSDLNVPFGSTDLSVQVQKMKDAKVDFVVTCMDTNGVTTLAKEMKKQNLDAKQFLDNAYDADFIASFGDLFQGSVVRVGTVPFESSTQPQGMKDYTTYLAKANGKKNEISLAGWQAADLFVTGLKAAGPEFNRQKLVDALNSITYWDANGINSGVDWTIAHDQNGPTSCDALVQIKGTAYQPVWVDPGKNFVCFPTDAPSLPDKPTFK